jgi:cold shock CspA family protein
MDQTRWAGREAPGRKRADRSESRRGAVRVGRGSRTLSNKRRGFDRSRLQRDYGQSRESGQLWSNELGTDWSTPRSDVAPSAAPRRSHRPTRPDDVPVSASRGVIYSFTAERGFGFVEDIHNLYLSPSERGKLRLFFHKSACGGAGDTDLMEAAQARRECRFTTVPGDRHDGKLRVEWLWLDD